MARTLNPRQQAFVREYLVDGNATAAARRAGYRGSDSVLAATGHELLRIPKVAEAILFGQQQLAARAEVSAERLLAEVDTLALSDLAEAFDEKGALLPVKDMPESIRRCIAGVKVRRQRDGSTITEVKLWDKVRAQELALKRRGLLKDKVELSGADGKALSITIDLGAGR